MAEPATVEDAGSSSASSEEDESVKMVETDIEETGVDPDGFFDDVETDDPGDDVSGMFDGDDEAEDDSGKSASSMTTGLADDINSGVARAAIIGLEDEWETDRGGTKTKDDLEDEFRETFEAFRLGHYAQICAEEYLLVEEDIHPVWGLIGASLICAAVIVYKRPDGEQLLDNGKAKLGNIEIPTPAGSDNDDG